ncbi:replicative DNA helicase [Pararhizobium capsulatum DSM 1112]|uniref:DNA 5'-3' helicase n=1 Tax=Pararhizobium capsulatum DSM 1112 TaxID=1121113 RepID=A0ABU0BP49_9HYPH|nr:DnaB-like helicase C-terminal domain-containing protein [Pararhizobium capsulatum]MDQ0320025.1 replicative DNA helicase [Pararhizobium capsulatum DSM 1112]
MNIQTDQQTFRDRISDQDAFEAAEIFFACMFSDNSILADCGLEPEDFVEGIHSTAFKAAVELYRGGQNVNSVSLKPSLPKVLKFKAEDRKDVEISPAGYLSQLMILGANAGTRSRLEGSIETIKGVALARMLSHEAEFGLEMSKEGHSLMTLVDEIEQLENRLKERRERLSALKSSASAGSSYLASFNAASKRDGVVGVPIALAEIAKVLSEPVFEAGNLYGLLSSSGEGKSSLTMQLIYHAIKQGHPVLFLSYDQSASQCIRQMIAQVHGIDIRQQRDPARMMSQSEQDTCVNFAMWIDRQPLEIIRCQREGVTQLVAYARRFIKRFANGRTPMVVLDHIGKVKPKDPKLSADRISGDVTVELKALADETAAAVLVLNQRNGFGDKRDNPRPIAADLYGGAGARADYDAVMYLYRAEKYKAEREKIAASDADWKKINKVFGSEIAGVAEIGSIKVRFGDPTITDTLKFEARYTRYVSERPAEVQGRLM